MQIVRYVIFVVVSIIHVSCSMSNKIAHQMARTYEYAGGKILGGDYVKRNRAFVLENIPRDFLKDFDCLMLIENVVSIQDYYSCAIFSDSLRYFYQASGLENPKQIDLDTNPLAKPELAIYIYRGIKQGDLADILEQGKKAYYVHPSSIYITIIKMEGKDLNISGYDLHEFVPREKQMEVDSIRNFMKLKRSD